MKKCDKCGMGNADNARYCCGCGYELPKPQIDEIQNWTPEPRKKNSNTSIIGMIVGGLIVIGAIFISQYLPKKLSSFEKEMVQVASEINSACPIMIDSETRLDNTIAIPPKTFQYNYTLINIEKDEIETSELKKYMEPVLINLVKTNPDMEYQRSNKVTVNYYYKDKDGNHLFTVIVKPEDYE